MSTDERNFRSTYYEKVGCRSVEEKKSLEILLKEKPLNKSKFKQFCLRFTVPAIHRGLLWKILLNVTPVFADSLEYVMVQRKAVYDDLFKALLVLRIIDEKTPKAKVFHAMWLLETRQLKLGFNVNQSDNNFVKITEVLMQISDNDVEIYWIAKGFYEYPLEIGKDFVKLKELTFKLLQKDDHKLYSHLESNNILNSLPLEKWYSSCFAGILTKPALIRIWDKICGGSRKIVVFVFIVLFNTLWRKNLVENDLKGLLDKIEIIKDNQEFSDQIVNKSIELWQQNKDHTELMFHRKDDK